jgi:hypothetical protein
MVRIMLEDLALTRISSDEEEGRRTVLASIDSLPVGYRTELGRLLLDSLHEARQPINMGHPWWRMRTFLAGPDRDQLGFAVCSISNEAIRNAFSTWLYLRHHERGERTQVRTLTSIGVLLTPRTDGRRDWDTTMCAVNGELELTEEEVTQYRMLWND